MNSIFDPKTYGAYFAFLIACLVASYEKLNQLHTPMFIGIIAALAIGSFFLYDENPGIFILVGAFVLEVYRVGLVKKQAI